MSEAVAAYAAISVLSAAVAGGSAYSQYKSSQQVNATAQDELSQQKAQQKNADDALALQQQQAAGKQQQDAQWMAMKKQASKMAGVAATAPSGLTQPTVGSQSGALGNLNTGGKKLTGQ